MFVDFNILNQLGSPSINSNTFVNRPSAGQVGRLFVSTDTFEIYRDNGTGWDLIGGPGSSTVTGSGAAGQVTYWTGTNSVGGENNLWWDDTNNHFGINTSTPGVALDVHSAADVGVQFNGTGATPSILQAFLSAGVSQYQLGYNWNSDINYRRFSIYDVQGAKEVISIDQQSRYVGINYQYSSLSDQPGFTFDVSGSGRFTDSAYFGTNGTGNVGINTTTPTVKLDVFGMIRAYNGDLKVESSSTRALIYLDTPNAEFQLDLENTSGTGVPFFGLWNNNPAIPLYNYSITVDYNTNNVGIGYLHSGSAQTPQYSLDVNGSARATNLLVKEQTAPGTPASGLGILYAKTDNQLYYKNDVGTEYNLTTPTTSASENLTTVAFQALGSSFKGMPALNTSFLSTNSFALASTNLYFIAYYLPTAQTITGVKWFQVTVGNYTANNYNGVGLYTYSAGTLTLVASSTNDGTIWQTAGSNTWKNKAFSSTYSATAGLYFIAFLYSSSAQVTQPSMGGGTTLSSGSPNYDFTNSAKASAVLVSQTSLPSSSAMSSLTTNTTNFTLALY